MEYYDLILTDTKWESQKSEPTHLSSKHIPAVVQDLLLSLVLAHFEMSLNF